MDIRVSGAGPRAPWGGDGAVGGPTPDPVRCLRRAQMEAGLVQQHALVVAHFKGGISVRGRGRPRTEMLGQATGEMKPWRK
jgi:hypothetical protein